MCLLASPVNAADDNVVTSNNIIVHPGTYSESDYTLQLLSSLLENAGGRYQASPLGYHPPRGRDFAMMEKREGIDIMWGSARHDRESRFLPIRIPIFKGLIGWRIPLVMQSNKDMFASVKTLDELAMFRPGQHFRWTDTKILKENGIDVFEVNNRASLMDMLISNKFDYFPRAAIEIEPEYESNRDKGVVIDQHVLIIYPTAFYFYVRKEDRILAEEIRKGLETMIANGVMDKLFATHFGPALNRLSVNTRQIFRLRNSQIPNTAPFSRKELWLDPAALPASLVNKSL